MLLYHGTHTGRLEGIVRQGLKPRGATKGNWKQYPSRPEFVYLSDAYAAYFAMLCEGDPAQHGGKMPQPAIVEIETDRLDKAHFHPDEDFLSQSLWQLKEQGEIASLPAPVRRLLRGCKSLQELHARIDPLAFQPLWEASLARLGNVAHYGPIAPEAITRYAQIDVAECRLIQRLATQPTICAANYLCCAAQYCSLLAHIFDGTPVQVLGGEEIARLNPAYGEQMAKQAAQMEAERMRGVRVDWR